MNTLPRPYRRPTIRRRFARFVVTLTGAVHWVPADFAGLWWSPAEKRAAYPVQVRKGAA